MNNRTCLVTKQEHSVESMLRFVLAPAGNIVPDLKRVLPGRGAYILAKKSLIAQGVKNNVLTRYFKAKQHKTKTIEITIEDDMAERIEKLLRRQILASLALGRKAGAVISGHLACDKAIRNNEVALLLHRIDAAQDGIDKLAQAVHSLGPTKKVAIKQLSIFSQDEVTEVFGERNAVHIAVLNSPIAKKILNNIDKLHIYRE